MLNQFWGEIVLDTLWSRQDRKRLDIMLDARAGLLVQINSAKKITHARNDICLLSRIGMGRHILVRFWSTAHLWMAHYCDTVGIDLGTTRSCVAVWDGTQVASQMEKQYTFFFFRRCSSQAPIFKFVRWWSKFEICFLITLDPGTCHRKWKWRQYNSFLGVLSWHKAAPSWKGNSDPKKK